MWLDCPVEERVHELPVPLAISIEPRPLELRARRYEAAPDASTSSANRGLVDVASDANRMCRDLYAVAALAGAALVVIGAALRFPASAVTITGAVLRSALRFMAIRRG
jgi:hypothetical protein